MQEARRCASSHHQHQHFKAAVDGAATGVARTRTSAAALTALTVALATLNTAITSATTTAISSTAAAAASSNTLILLAVVALRPIRNRAFAEANIAESASEQGQGSRLATRGIFTRDLEKVDQL